MDPDGLEELAEKLRAVVVRGGGAVTVDQIRDVLWECGISDLVEDLALARAVITAADGFHPVARFFAEGSAEREFIVRVLDDAAKAR